MDKFVKYIGTTEDNTYYLYRYFAKYLNTYDIYRVIEESSLLYLLSIESEGAKYWFPKIWFDNVYDKKFIKNRYNLI